MSYSNSAYNLDIISRIASILITDAFDKHLRIKINDKNFEWRFDDSLIIFKFWKVRLLKVLYILRMRVKSRCTWLKTTMWNVVSVVRRQLSDLGKKINSDKRPVFTRKKIADDIRVAEAKPPLINQQCVVYGIQMWSVWCGLCWLYSLTPFPTHCWTQALSYWKTPAWLSQSGEKRPHWTIHYTEEMSWEIWMLDLRNAFYPGKETETEHSIRLNKSEAI